MEPEHNAILDALLYGEPVDEHIGQSDLQFPDEYDGVDGTPLGDLSELDDALTGVPDTRQVEVEKAVRLRVKQLTEALNDGVHVDRGSDPPQAVAAPVVPQPSGPFAVFNPNAVADGPNDDAEDKSLAGALIQHGAPGLADLLRLLRQRYDERTTGQQLTPAADLFVGFLASYDSVIDDVVACRPALGRLRDLIGDPELAIPGPQAAAVLRFHDAYPEFWSLLVKRITRIEFNSGTADSRGGGLFLDGVIHMSALPYTPPGAFVRLFVHETGHATFDAMLVNDKPMPIPLSSGDLRGLLKPLGTDTWADRGAECETLFQYWTDMPPNARTFYQAWLTLRHELGSLCGIELWQDPKGHRLSPEQRQVYQAGKFYEFCAEMFMLYAMGDLHPYVLTVLADKNADVKVRTAWRNAWRVLTEVAGPILGQRHG